MSIFAEVQEFKGNLCYAGLNFNDNRTYIEQTIRNDRWPEEQY